MPTNQAKFTNEARVTIEGEIDISAAGAVGAVRGSLLTCTKTAGTGQYTVVVHQHGQNLVEELFSAATVRANSALGDVKDARVKSVTQATTDSTGVAGRDITIVIETDNASMAAVDEGTSVFTLCFQVVFRGNNVNMAAPL